MSYCINPRAAACIGLLSVNSVNFSNGEHRHYHHVANALGLLYYIHEVQHTSVVDVHMPNTHSVALDQAFGLRFRFCLVATLLHNLPLNSDEEMHQGCRTKYCDGSSSDKECWIRCDFCWKWWHYWCGGLEERQMAH